MNTILTINPGSTSTKIAIFKSDECVFDKTLRHSNTELEGFNDIQSQYEFRNNVILEAVKEAGFNITDFDAVVGRGGLFPKKKMESGTYLVTDKMIKDIMENPIQQHASNLGCRLADAIAKEANVNAYIVDPVVVDELADVARISGHKGTERKSVFHALNQKAIGLRMAKDCNKDYAEANLIVAHLGGGVSVGAHHNGRIVDVNKALLGTGPMSPERTGTLEIEDVINITYENKDKNINEIKKLFVGKGGVASYLGETDMREVLEMTKTNPEAKAVYEAFAYQVAKEIGSCSTVLKGKVDGIALTGGIAYSSEFVELIKERIEFIAPVYVYPGEDEMLALAQGALRVINKEETAKEY
jgi:butyrate kinase